MTPHSLIKIHTLCATSFGLFVVFFNEVDCWQYRVLSFNGTLLGGSRLYSTSDAALKAALEVGRCWSESGW